MILEDNLDLLNERLKGVRVGQRRRVAKLIGLTGRDLAKDAAHDLSGASLHRVRSGESRSGEKDASSNESSDKRKPWQSSVAHLREVGSDDDVVRHSEAADPLPDLLLQVVDHLVLVDFDVLDDADIGEDGLTLDLVIDADHRSFGARRVTHEGGLDLSGADAMAGLVDHVVHAARDPDVAVLVAHAAISSEVESGVLREVRLDVAAVIAVPTQRGVSLSV